MINDIIDFHTHPYLTEEHNFCFYKSLYNMKPEEYVQQLKRAGITHICGSVIASRRKELDENGNIVEVTPKIQKFTDIQKLNRMALQIKDVLGDFYTPGFHIHPGFYEESLEEIDFMNKHGVKLIGELVPYLHNWNDFDANLFHKLLDRAEQYHMVVSYHTPFDFDMNEVIATHPGINFVAAHPGERDRVTEHMKLMKSYPNYYLDLSGTGLMRFGMIRSIIEEVGAERIIFGTDYPICNPGMYVEAVKFEEISEQNRNLIFYENARKLLDL